MQTEELHLVALKLAEIARMVEDHGAEQTDAFISEHYTERQTRTLLIAALIAYMSAKGEPG